MMTGFAELHEEAQAIVLMLEGLATEAKGKPVIKAKKGKVDAKGKSASKGKNAVKAKSGAGHNPFKRQGHNGPAVGPIVGPREVDKQTHWDCSKSGAYKQICVNKETGKKKKITIKPKYKKMYNKLYRRWIASGDKK